MASAAVRTSMEYQLTKNSADDIKQDLVFITGKGRRSIDQPVLMETVQRVLKSEYGLTGTIEKENVGRLVLKADALRHFVAKNKWR